MVLFGLHVLNLKGLNSGEIVNGWNDRKWVVKFEFHRSAASSQFERVETAGELPTNYLKF
ncbi:hypothetical protein QQP08_016028 [Theobroma cacao]|nr:hypothetical protein QQP08_016028 [Theobroma cacao]